MNNVVLVGRLVRDPEIKNITADKSVTKFTLAVDRRFKNRDGQKQTDFIPIVMWGKTGEIAGQYLKKGSRCGVTGSMETRNYDHKDGYKVYITEVNGQSLELMDNKQDTNNNGYNDQKQNTMIDKDFHLIAADDDGLPF